MHFTAELTKLNQTWTVSHLLLHVHYRYHEAEGHLMNFTLHENTKKLRANKPHSECVFLE